MCTVLLPAGVNPISVNKYIISYRNHVTYSSETWVLKENMINKLMIFERRIMRKIFALTRTDGGYWW